MSSVITGKRMGGGTQMPVTWAALAAVLQTLVICVPGMIWVGSLNARVSHNEQWRATHAAEAVHRTEFEKLDTQAVRKAEWERVLAQLDRLETKMDSLLRK